MSLLFIQASMPENLVYQAEYQELLAFLHSHIVFAPFLCCVMSKIVIKFDACLGNL